jgi:MFS family permease
MWNALICKFDRYFTFGLALLLQGASYIAYAFVSANTLWLYIVVRLIQHVTGVLLSGVCSSILYDHLPNADRTNYLSFNFIVTNGAIFLALMADTLLAGIWGNGAISILGIPVYSTQVMIFASAVVQLLLGRLALKWSRTLSA